MGMPRKTEPMSMKVASSGRTPVSIHMDESSEISFLLRMIFGSTSLAVLAATSITEEGTSHQNNFCRYLGKRRARTKSFTKSMPWSDSSMYLSSPARSSGNCS